MQRELRFDGGVQFAGHETFPLRLLWLKKVFDHVGEGIPSRTFQEPKAIATFGVGRNMAVSMRHWAYASGLFVEEQGTIRATPLGHAILANDGFDPYLEQPATVWLVHWHVASSSERTTTIFYAFNGMTGLEFDVATLTEELEGLAQRHEWRATRGTLKRDVEVFLRSYVRRGDVGSEDAAEPLLAELSLVREAPIGGWFEFVRGPKPSLTPGVFAYALEQFWKRHGRPSALTAEQICYAPGSPGRVFKLDEDSVVTRLMSLGETTGRAWTWTDTAGLRQVQRISDWDPQACVAADYRAAYSKEAA